MTGYFVTGTDTGVGKTTVAAGMLAALRRRGFQVAALKPAETGCSTGPEDSDVDALRPADAELLRAAAGLERVPISTIAPWRYRLPVAPAVAARQEQRPFSLGPVLDARASLLAADPALLLVEGAGGLLVPYSDHLCGADLARELELPLLIVARASLGTINHTLLTIAEARRRGLRIAGIVLNRVVSERGADEDTNASEIQRWGDVRVLGTVEHLGASAPYDVAALASAIEAAFDPASLL